jgi:hypothetical protein
MCTDRNRNSAVTATAAVVAASLMLGAVAGCSDDGSTRAVSFASPSADASTAGSVSVVMKADGLTIEPAGAVHAGAGHFHLIADGGCLAKGATIPKDADHVHFGKGQTEGRIYLGPGTHELCLQMGDGTHVALDATDTVKVTVGVTSTSQWCAVAKEVDDLFTAADNSEDDFATKQVSYEQIRRLVAQLTDGLAHVDASVRPQVAQLMDFATTVAETYTEAADEAAAAAAADTAFAQPELPPHSAAAQWILSTCDVDVDS